jgi:alginate O-acetyltransferase complex protein AlgI
MLFSSLTFIFLFLPVVLAVYYLAPLKIRNLLLLLASLIFYAWGEPVYVVLMIYSSELLLWKRDCGKCRG